MKLKTFLLAAPLVLSLAACSCKKPIAGGEGVSDDTGQAVGAGQFDIAEGFLTGSDVEDRVFFALNKSNLSQEARHILDKQAEYMKKHHDKSFTVEGHCDERGTREYNLALGERRANSARKYLSSKGVQNPIELVSYGKERPAVDGHNEETWAKNRRAVTVVGGNRGE